MKKPITFKQAFIIVITLHVAGYFGISKVSEYRKQMRLAKAERQAKFKQIASVEQNTKNDWPSVIADKVNTGKQMLEQATTNVQPIVTNVSKTLNETVTQIEKQTKNVNIDTQELSQQISRLVPQPNNTAVKQIPRTDNWVNNKPIQQKKTPSRPQTINKTTTEIVFTPNTGINNSQPIISQKIYTVDGVQYIETKKIISSMIAL
jgi:hypothetical protein